MTERYSESQIRPGTLVRAVLLITLSVTLVRAGLKVAPDLVTSAAGTETKVIVQFRHAVRAADHQKIQQHGGSLRSELETINAASYTMPSEAVAALAADPDITYVSPDREVRGSLDFSDETINASIAFQAGIDG